MPSPTPLSPRMAQALTWLHSVGKATPSTLRRHGYSTRTLDALCERGLVDKVWTPTSYGSGFPTYRPLPQLPR